MRNTRRNRRRHASIDDASVCPLTHAPLGQDLRLCQLCEGRRMARRLAELGLTPGVCLRIVQDAGGPLLVSVRNSRIALGRGIADKLHVEVLQPAEESDTQVIESVGQAELPRQQGWRNWRRGAHRHDHANDEHIGQRGEV